MNGRLPFWRETDRRGGLPASILRPVILASERDEALIGADALIICTEWRQFRSPDFKEHRSVLKQPLIFDGRNMYDPDRMELEGIDYIGIGMGDRAVTPAPAAAD